MRLVEASREFARWPLEKAASRVHRVGTTALELIDSERLVRRLSREHQASELELAFQDLEFARANQDVDSLRTETRHLVRLISRGLAVATQHEVYVNAGYLEQVKALLAENMEGMDIENLGLSEHELLLLRGMR